MYRDNTLVPSEAIRLLALGILATGTPTYAGLARDVRYFIGHVVGPSLDLVAPPIEVLKVEGLIEPLDPDAGEDSRLRITEDGRAELTRLLTANVRAPISDINKLIITLKMRFLHLLDSEDRQMQIEIMIEMCERQIARLSELRADHGEMPGHLTGWLDHEIAQLSERLRWFQDLE